MRTLFLKVVSLFVVLTIIVNILPLNAFASTTETVEENPQNQEYTDSIALDNSLQQTDAFVLYENEEKRTEFGKDFMLSNGLNLAVVYPYAVHFEENGQWKEIDNTLTASTNQGTAVYKNKTGAWNVYFPQTLTSQNNVSVSKDGYTLSFGMAGELRVSNVPSVPGGAVVASVEGNAAEEMYALSAAQSSVAQIQETNIQSVKKEAEHPETVCDTASSRLLYANVYGNTSIIYDLLGNQIKESIVIRSYDAGLRGYRYALNTGSMIPVLQEDGSIVMYTSDRQTVVFTMPAPYMVDSNGEYSGGINITLSGGSGNYTLTYVLPTAWLADEARAWPVILDPVVDAESSTSNIADRTVAEERTLASNWGMNACGYRDGWGIHRFYMKFIDLPTLGIADNIVHAEVTIYDPYNPDTYSVVEVHEVLSTWTSSGMTWANAPGYNETVSNFIHVTSSGYYTIDVTDLARGWYESENTGMVFKMSNAVEQAGVDDWKQFYSCESGSIKPTLQITYRNINGLEDYWDYTTSSAGRAGTGYVNNVTGNLTWVHNDIGFSGNLMPVAISHVYTAGNSDSNAFGLGYGWRTNYHQTVALSETGQYYIWTDGDGTEHDFCYDSNIAAYTDKDGLFLTLAVNSDSYIISDKYGNTSEFDSNGRLVKQTNNQATQSSIVIEYNGTSSRIAKITDGVGRLYVFVYNSSNLLTEISYYGKNGASGTKLTYIRFAYSSSNLVTITYKDALDSHFTYSGHYLTAATDVDDYKVALSYSSGNFKRVTSVKEYDGQIQGNTISIEYARNKVRITNDEHTQIKHYNDYGNLISTQDDQGNAQFNQYTANKYTDCGDYGNQLVLVSKEQSTVTNLLRHSSFESNSIWSATSLASSTRTTAKAYVGNYSLKITFNSAASGICAYGAAITVPAKKSCTFSAYVQSSDASVQLGLGTTTSAYAVSGYESTGSGWIHLEVSYTNTSSGTVSVYPLLMLSEGGIVYIDCVQAEISAGASRYNLVQNGDFRTTDAWSSSAGRTTQAVSAAPQLDANVYKLTGNPTGTQSIHQTIAIKGSKGDVFVLSGWAKGHSVPLSDSSRQFALKITFNHTDGSTNTATISFNSEYDAYNEWQCAAGRAEAGEAYSSVKIELVYNYNANDVYFDGIQLFKEEFGERYYYDQDGNLITATDALGQETHYTYSNNDLVKVVDPSGLTTQYTYDNHNVTRSLQAYTHNNTTVNLASYSYTYDNYGNQLRAYSEIDGVVKQTYTSYSSDKNHIATTTDELGNVTTYEYDLQTSVLLSVKHPKDTDATKTTYEYDVMYRLVKTSATTDQNKTMSATYTYSEDLLTKIAAGSTVYNFTYGDFGLRTKVAVGSVALANYTYTDDPYRQIATIDYGNQDKVKYFYDDLGRVIKEEYYENGSTSVSRTITYEYDNTGALATMVDTKTGVTTKYYYDTIGRNTGVYENGGSSAHRMKYTYDELGRLQKFKETCGNATYTTEYSYYGNGQIDELITDGSKEKYFYDAYSRLENWYTYHGNSSSYLIYKNIYYAQPDDRTTSSWPTVWAYTSSGGYRVNYNYSYDANGNIVSEYVGGKTTTYVYDSANQLIRENNERAGKTWVWTYDSAGNIQTRKEYAYTISTLGSCLDTITYTYGNTNWKDLLTKYDGVTITYDSIGNPLSDGTWTYTWQQGRDLATMSKSGTTWTFTYDANGMRTKRTNGSTTYTYTYHGDQLSHMTTGSAVLHFYYDASGNPLSVTYGGSTYYYVLNLQGDVVAILNSSGVQVVGYTYDTWGRPLSTTGSMSSTLGLYNPLRYRGYVYDTETGLYYLQSRYYNPTWGRFINSDSQLNPQLGLLGFNAFAYCSNNPINYSDYSGNSATIAGGIIGGVCGFFGALFSELGDDNDGVRWDKVMQCTASTALAGAMAGFVADVSIATFGAGTAMLIAAGAGVLASGVNSMYTQTVLSGDFSWGKVISDGIIGGITNGLCTGTSSVLDPIVSGLSEGIGYAFTQVCAELTPGLLDITSFVVIDLIPTAITGAAGFIAGYGYDYLTR